MHFFVKLLIKAQRNYLRNNGRERINNILLREK